MCSGRDAGRRPRGNGRTRAALSVSRRTQSEKCLNKHESDKTHFLVKLFLAAPASFLSLADTSQLVAASRSHFFMKLVMTAPASFFSEARVLIFSHAALRPDRYPRSRRFETIPSSPSRQAWAKTFEPSPSRKWTTRRDGRARLSCTRKRARRSSSGNRRPSS